MKLVQFTEAGRRRLGFLVGETVVDPLRALGTGATAEHQVWFADSVSFLASGAAGRTLGEELIASAAGDAVRPRSDVALDAPMYPSTILATGSNYPAHNAEKANAGTSGKEPEFFVKTSDCVVGPDAPIVLDPALTAKLDCETELAIVIGAPGRHIPLESALDHVFGYTIVDDVTARDRQVRRSPEGFVWYELGKGKCFDSSAPLGPAIVSADEVGDPQDLTITTRVNGELRQSGSTAEMIWTCAEIVHFFSTSFTLKPGMVIITGTPAGTAWAMDAELGGAGVSPPGVVPSLRYLAPGDVIENEIENLGVLRNTVVHI